MCGRARLTIMDIYKWRGLIPNGEDILAIFTKNENYRETCLKESVSLLWTCWDSDKGDNHVQTTMDIAFRTQQNNLDKGYTNLGVPQTIPIADIIDFICFSEKAEMKVLKPWWTLKSNEYEMEEKIIETLRESMNWKYMISQNPGMERVSSQKI